MNEAIFQKLQAVFKEVFDADPVIVTIDAGPDQIAKWDSLGHASLASAIEIAFNISLDIDDLMAMENVRAIQQIIEAKVKSV